MTPKDVELIIRALLSNDSLIKTFAKNLVSPIIDEIKKNNHFIKN